MGEIADDMVDGCCCSQCGVYFTEENGYPVLCWSCWKDVPSSEFQHIEGQTVTCGLQRSRFPELS
jgi:hypothetical protein